MPPRASPIILEPKPSNLLGKAALIFLHGLSDEASGVSNIGTQLQSSSRLNYFKYIFPNALENRDMMATAWYIQSRLTSKPAPRPELEDDEDEEGLLQSVAYVESLISNLVSQDSIPLERIVIGGFSQGMAVTLLLSLVSSKFAGKLGGVLAVCGYLPLQTRISQLRSEHGMAVSQTPGQTRILVLRGKADVLVPQRYLSMAKDQLAKAAYTESDGDDQVANLIVKEYEGVGHTITGRMIADIASWLEEIVPGVEITLTAF